MGRGLCMVLAFAMSSAGAVDESEGSRFDPRIRYVTYNAEDVVVVEAVVGVATHLVLEPGETYVTHAFGDAKAWEFAVKGHHYFLKAVAANADSNLTIVTDRRSYHFALKLAASDAATYELSFRYPDSVARKSRDEARRRDLEQGFGKRGGAANLAYSMSGDLDIAPVNAWDNGEFTYFKFPGNRDIPAIYMVDVEGAESIVNRHSEGPANEIVVAHKVAARWALRLGTRALAVWNDAYDSEGRRNKTQTASPDLRRVLWK